MLCFKIPQKKRDNWVLADDSWKKVVFFKSRKENSRLKKGPDAKPNIRQ